MNSLIHFIIFIMFIMLMGTYVYNQIIVKETFISTLNKHISKQKRKIRLHRNYIHKKYIDPIKHIVKKKLLR